MKKIILIVIFVAVFVTVIFVLNRRLVVYPVTTTTPTASPATTPVPTAPVEKPAPTTISKTFEVIISPNGLSQSTLSIKIGNTVTFTNADTVLHWPASGMHPTHQICPGFDSLRGLKQGEKYSFTFEKAAVCPFHDHLNAGNPAYRGSITVTE